MCNQLTQISVCQHHLLCFACKKRSEPQFVINWLHYIREKASPDGDICDVLSYESKILDNSWEALARGAKGLDTEPVSTGL